MNNLNKMLTQVPADIFFNELSKAILAAAKNNLAAARGNTIVNPAIYTFDEINPKEINECQQTRKPSPR